MQSPIKDFSSLDLFFLNSFIHELSEFFYFVVFAAPSLREYFSSDSSLKIDYILNSGFAFNF